MMIRQMLAAGRPPPEFSEIGGPYVRVILFGGPPDPAMFRFIGAVEPRVSGSDILRARGADPPLSAAAGPDFLDRGG